MKLDTLRLNQVAHAAGQALIEISLENSPLTKTSLSDKLESLAMQSKDSHVREIFAEAAQIVLYGPKTDIEFTDDDRYP